MALALVVSTAGAAGWTEGFDTYTPSGSDINTYAGTPWFPGTNAGPVTGSTQFLSSGLSAVGTTNTGGSPGARPQSFRSVDPGNDTLEFSMYIDVTSKGSFSGALAVTMSSHTNQCAFWGNVLAPNVILAGDTRGAADGFVFRSTAGPTWNIDANLNVQTWYDIKMELQPTDLVLWSYKAHSSGTWIDNPAGAVAAPARMTFDYVFIEMYDDGNGGVYLDDVKVLPEPATMALLGIGGLMVLRRRRAARGSAAADLVWRSDQLARSSA